MLNMLIMNNFNKNIKIIQIIKINQYKTNKIKFIKLNKNYYLKILKSNLYSKRMKNKNLKLNN